MPIDELTRQFLKEMTAGKGKPLRSMSAADLRESNASLRPRFGRGTEMGRVANETVRAESGGFGPTASFVR